MRDLQDRILRCSERHLDCRGNRGTLLGRESKTLQSIGTVSRWFFHFRVPAILPMSVCNFHFWRLQRLEFSIATERPNVATRCSLLLREFFLCGRCLLAVRRYVASGLRISFWVGLLTTPLIWHHFHVVSLVSIPLNVVLSIPLMIGLLCGLATGLVAWIPWLGSVTGSMLGAISGSCLALIQGCVELAYQVPLVLR